MNIKLKCGKIWWFWRHPENRDRFEWQIYCLVFRVLKITKIKISNGKCTFSSVVTALCYWKVWSLRKFSWFVQSFFSSIDLNIIMTWQFPRGKITVKIHAKKFNETIMIDAIRYVCHWIRRDVPINEITVFFLTRDLLLKSK